MPRCHAFCIREKSRHFGPPLSLGVRQTRSTRTQLETNCQNCGAVLSLEQYQDTLHCEFCGTVHIPSLREEQGIEKLQGITSGKDCPLCETDLSHAKLSDWRFHYCSSCRGFLINGADLLKIIRYVRGTAPRMNRKPEPIDPAHLNREISCPHCSEAMSAHPYYGPGDYVIDSCTSCRCVWLDAGELRRSSTVKWGGVLWP